MLGASRGYRRTCMRRAEPARYAGDRSRRRGNDSYVRLVIQVNDLGTDLDGIGDVDRRIDFGVNHHLRDRDLVVDRRFR